MRSKIKSYAVVARDRVWHLTQRQARPPEKSELGCNTVCGVWAMMKDGYERGTPTCPVCLQAIVEYESTRVVPFSPEPLDECTVGILARLEPQTAHFSVGSRRRRRGG